MMMTAIEILERRVENGVIFLDRELPWWETIVNEERLDAGTYGFCPLGQIALNDYDRFRRLLPLLRQQPSISQLGFYLSLEDLAAGYKYQDLTACWEDLIASRRLVQAAVH